MAEARVLPAGIDQADSARELRAPANSPLRTFGEQAESAARVTKYCGINSARKPGAGSVRSPVWTGPAPTRRGAWSAPGRARPRTPYEEVALVRRKWFVPAGDGDSYSPFGLDCEGAATLYGHRGRWNLAAATGSVDRPPEQITDTNRVFRAPLRKPGAVTKPNSGWLIIRPWRRKGPTE